MQPAHGADPAGLDIHGRAVEADVGSDYDSYKTFEIEFENSPSMFPPFTPSSSFGRIFECGMVLMAVSRPGQLCPQVGRGGQGAPGPARAARADPGGHGVVCVYGAAGKGRVYVISALRCARRVLLLSGMDRVLQRGIPMLAREGVYGWMGTYICVCVCSV